jgi:tetratricopeptide (TPR) repeat protein
MSLTVALIATLALTAPADGPRDAAGWRQQSDALYSQGDFHGALDAAEQARALDRADPWARYAWIRALAAIDAEAARKALPGLINPAALQRLPAEDRARLDASLGYLCLDLGVEPGAALHFEAVPAGTPSFPEAQAGLAILAVRRGHARQALVHFVSARATGKLDPPLAELERETRFQVELQQFATARDLRDANAAGRAYSVLDELRPNHGAADARTARQCSDHERSQRCDGLFAGGCVLGRAFRDGVGLRPAALPPTKMPRRDAGASSWPEH